MTIALSPEGQSFATSWRRAIARNTTAVAAASALVVLVATVRTPQGLYQDPAWQLAATTQYVADRSPALLSHAEPAPANLATDRAEWLSWWAPGIAIVGYPLLGAGVSVGTTVRLVAALCLLVGTVGWARWVRRFELKAPWSWLLPALIPWIRYSANPLFLFSAESFVFAVAPWAFLAAADVTERERPSPWHALVVGLALGAGYWLKYSILLPALGAALFVAFAVWRRRGPLRALPFVAALGLGLMAPVVAVSALNHTHRAAANLVTASVAPHVSLEAIGFAVANIPLMLADADAFWHYILLNPGHAVPMGEPVMLLIGLPGALWLAWLLTRRRLDAQARLALTIACTTMVLLLGLWSVSKSVSMEARHVAAAALALLPLAVRETLRQRSVPALAGGFLFLGLPLLYGPIASLGKVRRTLHYHTSSTRLGVALLAPDDAAACVASLPIGRASDVWYVTDPASVIELAPRRTIVVPADFVPLDSLTRTRYVSQTPLNVYALIPTTFDTSAKGEAIRRSFLGADKWTRTTLPACAVSLWTTHLEAPGS